MRSRPMRGLARRISRLLLSHPLRRGLMVGAVGACLLFVLMLIGPHHAAAQGATSTPFSVESVGSQIGVQNTDLKVVVINIMRWALGIMSLLALIYIIYGGFLWLTSRGDENQIEKAKRVILQAAIGIVVILLAWAIVYFVAKTVRNIVGEGGNGPGPGPGCGNNCVGTNNATFDVTAITSCAVRPDFAVDVPRQSNISIVFNTDVTEASAQKAVEDTTALPNLVIEQCTDPTCASVASPMPKPIAGQQFSGATAKGAVGKALAEWVATNRTITFYHKSFSPVETSLDNLYFDAGKTYRITIPSGDTNDTALRDVRDRVLAHCQQSTGVPIEGGHCEEKSDGRILWTFTVGQDISGKPLNRASTVPSSTYLTDPASQPDRDVNRNSIIGIDFTGAVDPATITTDNIQVYKFTAPPDVHTGAGGTTEATPLPPGNFIVRVNSTGTGAWLQLTNGNLFDAFTWYKVQVQHVRNLCGTEQDPALISWVFETNAVTPGIKQVYPREGFAFACPNTKVFIQFNTSMWRIDQGNDCSIGTGNSYVTSGTMSPNPGRVFNVQDQLNKNDPNHTCTTYAFTPASLQLTPNQPYSISVKTDMSIDISGKKLNKDWGFTVAPPEKCINQPFITKISPSQGPDGMCLSAIGGYFGSSQQPGNTMTFGAVNQGTADNWTDRAIVSTLKAGAQPADQSYPYKVTVNYPSPVGPQESNAIDVRLLSGQGSLGPCLVSLSKDSGPNGTTLTASGKRFGTYSPATSRVRYSSPGVDWGVKATGWTDTIISPITVQNSDEGEGLVSIIDNGPRESNQLPFTVTPKPPAPPGGTPAIEETTQCSPHSDPVVLPSPNPVANDLQACLNSVAYARFTMPMDPATLTPANIYLEKCVGPLCTPVATTLNHLGDQSFTLTPTAKFDAATQYRVTVTASVTSAPPKSVPLAAAYVWTFTTKADGTDCPISDVIVQPSNSLFRTPTFTQKLRAFPLDAACHIINKAGLSYAWASSKPEVADLLPSHTAPDNIATSPPTGSVVGTTDVTATTEGKVSSPSHITYNPTACTKNDECVTNTLGELCTGSTCQNGQCTPVVNGFEPDNGKAGTWTTIKGCWFGSYKAGTSTVLFSDNVTAGDPLVCGPDASWRNERIVRVVPDNTTPTPKATVRRGDGQTATSTATFTINNQTYPGICSVTPIQAFQSQGFILTGARFENTQQPADQVLMSKVGGGTIVPATNIIKWQDAEIDTQVPNAAEIGYNDIHVKKGAVQSNPVILRVRDPSEPGGGGPGPGGDQCKQQCTVDNDCAPLGANYACGTGNCCWPRPKFVSSRPPNGATDICLNTAVAITFDQPLDPSTVTSASVHYTNGATPVTGQVSVANRATSGTIIYAPGLLSKTTAQHVSLDPTITSTKGVAIDTAGTNITFTTGTRICTGNKVAVDPSSHLFTTVGDTYTYSAELREGNDPLAEIPAIFEWIWSWASGNDQVASVPTADQPTSDVVAKQSGTTDAIASAKITVDSTNTIPKICSGGSKNGRSCTRPADCPGGSCVPNKTVKGRGQVVVNLCQSPSLFSDNGTNCTSGGACTNIHFDLSACLDPKICTTGPKLNTVCTVDADCSLPGQPGTCGATLPDFLTVGKAYQAVEGQNATDPERLKSFFFKTTNDSRDTIGMLVYTNPNLLPPPLWIKDHFRSITGGSTTMVAGYPAVRAGTTTYIGISDFDDPSASLRGLMVVIDYNSNNASPQTKAAYDKMLSNLSFNTNLDSLARQQVQLDTRRRNDLVAIARLLADYKTAKGEYPKLDAGSYIPGMSTSAWPSWLSTLGNALGSTLQSDAVNAFRQCTDPADPSTCVNQCTEKQCVGGPTPGAGCAIDDDCGSGGKCLADSGYDPKTCWKEATKTFTCPADSRIYAYTSDGNSYGLYATMDYTDAGSFATGPADPCSDVNYGNGSLCSCFNYKQEP